MKNFIVFALGLLSIFFMSECNLRKFNNKYCSIKCFVGTWGIMRPSDSYYGGRLEFYPDSTGCYFDAQDTLTKRYFMRIKS